jgi:hypothetical protein
MEYMESVRKWKLHSNMDSFTSEFNGIIAQFSYDNNTRSRKIEEFLIREAKKAGVIKAHPIKI